eukprot:1140457-Pelagomonas_calceolata.AAC.4
MQHAPNLSDSQRLSKLHGMMPFLLPVIFVMSEMMCRMNSMLFSNAPNPKVCFLRLRYASFFSGPPLLLSHPSPHVISHPSLALFSFVYHPSQHVMQNVSRFRLKAHTLYVETASSEDGISPVCDRCSCGQIQDEAHVLFMCRCEGLCALRQKSSELFWTLSGDFSPAHPFLQHQLSL